MSTSTHPCIPCQLVGSRGCFRFTGSFGGIFPSMPWWMILWAFLHSNTRRDGDPHRWSWEERGGADASSWHEGAGNLQAMTETERSQTTGWTLTSEGPLMFINKCQKILIKLKSDVYSNAANRLKSLKTLNCMVFLSICYLVCYFQPLQHLPRYMMSCRWNWLFHEQTVN